MPTIGPSFADELTAAGITDRRFTWSPGTGSIEYHPDMPDAERQKVEAVLAAHDGPLSEARHQALEATRAEASRRIAALFDQPPGSLDLAFAELNTLARAVGIIEKGGAALPEEQLDLDGLKGMWARIQAIRDAGRDAKEAIQGAKTVGEVRTVRPGWPE
jgi:hypothetical protein